MIMSSFILNTTQYTDPKFPPADDYPQLNYIPNHPVDFYRPNQYPPHTYGFPDPRRYEEEKYNQTNYGHCNQESVSPPQPSPPVSTHGGGGGGTVSGYSQPSSSPSPPSSPAESDSPGSQTSCAQQSDGQPVIYPWMKKSQGNNSGKIQINIKLKFDIFLYTCSIVGAQFYITVLDI